MTRVICLSVERKRISASPPPAAIGVAVVTSGSMAAAINAWMPPSDVPAVPIGKSGPARSSTPSALKSPASNDFISSAGSASLGTSIAGGTAAGSNPRKTRTNCMKSTRSCWNAPHCLNGSAKKKLSELVSAPSPSWSVVRPINASSWKNPMSLSISKPSANVTPSNSAARSGTSRLTRIGKNVASCSGGKPWSVMSFSRSGTIGPWPTWSYATVAMPCRARLFANAKNSKRDDPVPWK